MQSKTDLFPPDVARLAEVARALGHPARLAILQTLAARGTCICGEVVQEIPLAQATVSQHLKALKDAGLVCGEIDGPRSCYCLDVEALRNVMATMVAFLEPLTASAPDCCGDPGPDDA